MEKNLKNIRKQFKEQGVFYTSGAMAELLKSYVDFTPTAVYDPTCGQGNLLSVFPDDLPKYGQEINAEELEKARERLRNFHGFAGDTLTNDGFPDMRFDCIVANPPFSVKWTPNGADPRFTQAGTVPPPGKADYAFLLHILYHLSEHGKAVCLQFPGVLYRGQREGKIRRWMVEQNLIERVVRIPGKSFVDTQIETCIIVFNKSKLDTNITFEDSETGAKVVATLEDVRKQDFTLSTSAYIQTADEREAVDIKALNAEIDAIVARENELRAKINAMIPEIEEIHALFSGKR